MQRTEGYLARPAHFVKLFQDMRHKLNVMQHGPKFEYEDMLLQDLPSPEFLRLRSQIRKQGYADSLNAANALVRVRTKTPAFRGRSVSKVGSETKHRILQMREEQYRAAFLEPTAQFVRHKFSLKGDRSNSPFSGVGSRIIQKSDTRGQCKSVQKIRAPF